MQNTYRLVNIFSYPVNFMTIVKIRKIHHRILLKKGKKKIKMQ